MTKYLKSEEIKPNHIYLDSKNNELIYLGKASQNDGCWSYPSCYIYIKKEKLNKYPKTMPLEDILNDLANKGVRHYQFSEKHRKFIKEIEEDSRAIIKGKHGIFSFE